MANQSATRITVDDFRQLPESNLPHELIDGALIVAPAPKDDHQASSIGVLAILINLTAGRGTLRHQPTDLYINPTTVLQPDIFWVAEGGSCVLGDDGYWHGAPDLVVEILSPSTAFRDRGVKFDLYEQHGVHEYWLVDPVSQFVEIFVRENDSFTRRGPIAQSDTFKSTTLNATVDCTRIFQA